MTARARSPWSLVAGLLLACGGGGGDGGGSPQDPEVPPPSELGYAANPPVYSRGFAILPNAPSHDGGEVESFSVAPELPAGLAFDAGTGAISGTPTALAAEAAYVVTATNSGGSTTASLRLSVVEPFALAYELEAASYMRWVGVEPNAPTSAPAGATYSVSPALPTGLVLDAATGVISGTPAVAAAAADYTVLARSPSSGSGQAVLHLAVADGNPTLVLSPGAPSPEAIAALVSGHNAARHGALDPLPDPALPNLVWDPLLAQLAKTWAEKCDNGATWNVSDLARDYQALGGSGTVGENRAWSNGLSYTVGGVLEGWMEEAEYYDYAAGSCGYVCKHYTQMVRRATTRVGCAMADCPLAAFRYATVCTYSPGGVPGERPY